MPVLLQAVVGTRSVRYELLHSWLTSTWSEHQGQARVAMNSLFTVCLLEEGLPHPWPVCLTTYLQVFRIFHTQLQELEVTATRPCDTLAQLLLHCKSAPGFREVGRALCIHGGVAHPIFLLQQRQIVSHWLLFVLLRHSSTEWTEVYLPTYVGL